MWASLRRAGRWSLLGAGGLAPVLAYEAYTYRPRASFDVDFHEKMRGVHRLPTNAVDRFFYNLTMTITTGTVATIFWAVAHGLHDVEFIDHDKLLTHVRGDRGGAPLITVCNHQSTLDDPMFQAALLPADVRWSAKRMRWGVCTEEICFSSPAIASFMGMGKALPIQRGGSIHQKAMATLQAKVNAGDWVHVFPEARVWQENGTPQRDADGRWCSAGGRCGPSWQKVGPMKWGVGKIVANAAAPPVIVPYYHQGMCYVRPQRSDNEYQTDWPIFNVRKQLTVKFGDPVEVRDLIDAYHAHARQRALQRNAERERDLAAALSTADARTAAAAAAVARASSGRSSSWWARVPGFGGGAAAAPASAAAPARQLPAAAPSATSGSWLSWWRGSSGTGGGAGSSVESFSDHSGASARLHGNGGAGPASAVPSSRDPINTVEEASDHTGASAKVAGLAVPAPPAAIEADVRREAHAATMGARARSTLSSFEAQHPSVREASARARATLSSFEARVTQLESAVLHGVDELEAAAKGTAREVGARAREVEAKAAEAAESLEARARQRVGSLQAAARETADGIEARAHELVSSLRRLQEALDRETGGGSGGKPAGAGGDKAAASTAPAAAAPSSPSPSAIAAGASASAVGAAADELRRAVDGLSQRWAHSVSVPAPPKLVVPVDGAGRPASAPADESAAAAPAAAAPAAAASGDAVSAAGPSRSSSSSTSVGSSSPASVPLPSGRGVFPLSDEPVVEVVPTRVLRTGATVPTYIEAPLRAKPPDHLFLTPSQAAEEETHRLQLYSDIAARVQGAVAALERDVMAHRAAKGIAEERPMR